jgi:hypothetical protein
MTANSRGARLLLALGLLTMLSGTARSETASGVAEEGDLFGVALATGDFDGDGKDDLASGVPGEDIGGEQDAGAVNVVYGSGSGLTPNGNQVWYQGTVGIAGGPEPSDQFGGDLAVGDFDGDGFDDLAIGVVLEDISSTQNAGAVNVIYGSANGLTEVDDQLLTQDEPEAFDIFSASLAAGDFNGDGDDDLAVGAPSETIESLGLESAGVVTRFFGSDSGLSENGSDLTQNSLDNDQSEDDDEFGSSLAAGNLGAGPEDDLVIGIPHEQFNEFSEGAVAVLYGSTSFTTDQFWHQDVPGVANQTESGDRFGLSLAIGNFGHGRPADLAVGAPGEGVEVDAGEVSDAGVVHILYGTPEFGLTEDNDQLWHQSKPGVADRIEVLDSFGSDLTAGQFGNGKRSDLAVGVPAEGRGSGDDSKIRAGVAHVLFGTKEGLSSARDELWHQDVDGIKDSAETFDAFGTMVASGNFGAGSTEDLAVGVREDLGGRDSVGAVSVIYGTEEGLTATGDQFWHQVVP